MVLNGIPISDDECIGDSLATINSAFQTLSTEVTTIDNTLNISSLTAILDDYFVPANGGSSSGVPTGSVTYYSLSSAPTGWVECNGAAITVAMGSSYTALRTLLLSANNPFGVSGSDPLLPDLRGRFIRSFGTDSTVSPVVSSAAFGTKQGDAMQGHKHTYNVNTTGAGSSTTLQAGGVGVSTFNTVNTVTDGINGTPRTASETRPANLALLACIKL